MSAQATESSLLGTWSPPQALEACWRERKLDAQPSGHTATSEPNKETQMAEASQAGVPGRPPPRTSVPAAPAGSCGARLSILSPQGGGGVLSLYSQPGGRTPGS